MAGARGLGKAQRQVRSVPWGRAVGLEKRPAGRTLGATAAGWALG